MSEIIHLCLELVQRKTSAYQSSLPTFLRANTLDPMTSVATHHPDSAHIAHQSSTPALRQGIDKTAETALELIQKDFHELCESLRTKRWDSREQIGFELEGVLVRADGAPLFAASHALAEMRAAPQLNLGGELITSNFECSPGPHLRSRAVFQELFDELVAVHTAMADAARVVGGSIALCGTLPSYQAQDFTSDVLSSARARKMNDFLLTRRGGSAELSLKSFDGTELFSHHATSMAIEGITSSLQVQMSAEPEKLPSLYNAALVAMGCVLAGSSNSPFLCDVKGWHESRIGLLQNGIIPERFFLSSGWAASPEDLFRDILDFEVITDPAADAPLCKEKGLTPFKALKGHNGTVWKWVRPCIGEDGSGLLHMRLELRSLPAGPSVIDEAANAAFLVCLVHGIAQRYPSLPRLISLADVCKNHDEAAKLGLEAPHTWLDGERMTAREMILQHALPLARQAAISLGFNTTITYAGRSVDLLEVFERRVITGHTGSQWALNSIDALHAAGVSRTDGQKLITQAMLIHQKDPLHEVACWPTVR